MYYWTSLELRKALLKKDYRLLVYENKVMLNKIISAYNKLHKNDIPTGIQKALNELIYYYKQMKYHVYKGNINTATSFNSKFFNLRMKLSDVMVDKIIRDNK